MADKQILDSQIPFNVYFQDVDSLGNPEPAPSGPVTWSVDLPALAIIAGSSINGKALVTISGQLGTFTVIGNMGEIMTARTYEVTPGAVTGHRITDDLG